MNLVLDGIGGNLVTHGIGSVIVLVVEQFDKQFDNGGGGGSTQQYRQVLALQVTGNYNTRLVRYLKKPSDNKTAIVKALDIDRFSDVAQMLRLLENKSASGDTEIRISIIKKTIHGLNFDTQHIQVNSQVTKLLEDKFFKLFGQNVNLTKPLRNINKTDIDLNGLSYMEPRDKPELLALIKSLETHD